MFENSKSGSRYQAINAFSSAPFSDPKRNCLNWQEDEFVYELAPNNVQYKRTHRTSGEVAFGWHDDKNNFVKGATRHSFPNK